MNVFVALPRSINTGKRKVLKEDLLGVAQDLGFKEARTYLASGNLVLWGDQPGGVALEGRLEDALEARMDLRTDFMVRSAAQLRAVIDGNPFAAEALDHPSHVIVNFLKSPLPDDDETILRAAISGPERFAVGACELYLDFPITHRRLGVGSGLEKDQAFARRHHAQLEYGDGLGRDDGRLTQVLDGADWTHHGKVRAREAGGALTLVVDGLTTQGKYYKPLIYEFFRKSWRGSRPAWGEFSVEIGMEYVGEPPWMDLDNLAKALLDAIKGYAFHDDAQVARLLVERRPGERERIVIQVRKLDTNLMRRTLEG